MLIIKKEDVTIQQEEMNSMSNGQRHTRRAQPGVLEHESIQRATTREKPGVIEYESIQRATARLDPARREEEN